MYLWAEPDLINVDVFGAEDPRPVKVPDGQKDELESKPESESSVRLFFVNPPYAMSQSLEY